MTIRKLIQILLEADDIDAEAFVQLMRHCKADNVSEEALLPIKHVSFLHQTIWVEASDIEWKPF